MFTGLIEAPRPVAAARARRDAGLDLDVDLGALAEGVQLGDSIAISGACLTVARLAAGVATFELSRETLERTRLGDLAAGARVNVERSLRVGDRLGGHIVQGHVDGLGVVRRLAREGAWAELEVEVPPSLLRYVVEKGSIAIDGVSLTVAKLAAPSITIALVPLTLDKTTLGERKAGDRVHLEVDEIAKYVERLAEPYGRR